MPFDPQELDSLDDGFEPPDEPGELDDDEIEGDPSTWDLGSGRAAAHSPRYVSAAELDVAELIAVVCDGVAPDGSAATVQTRASALAAWREKDPTLARELHIALTGKTPAGETVDGPRRDAAYAYVERRRSRWLESGDAFAPPASASQQGRRPAGRHALRVTTADGSSRLERLGNDDAAVREAAANLSGVSMDELCAPFTQGPQTDADRARRARQALTIYRLVELGATQRAVGRVFGLAPGRVSERAAIGQQLAARLGSVQSELLVRGGFSRGPRSAARGLYASNFRTTQKMRALDITTPGERFRSRASSTRSSSAGCSSAPGRTTAPSPRSCAQRSAATSTTTQPKDRP